MTVSEKTNLFRESIPDNGIVEDNQGTAEIKTTCCYCGVGCGILATVEKGSVTHVRGDPSDSVNRGGLCAKGALLHLTLDHNNRLLFPSLRTSRTAQRTRVAYDEALDYAAQRFSDIIRRHGQDSVAFYVSGQLLTEDYYVFNKLAKALIGTNNIDSNSRLCMSSAVASYKTVFGTDGPPCCYDDIEAAELIFIAGANPAVAHPILFRRIEAAKQANPRLKIIVCDPIHTETAAIADVHVPINSGSDIAFFNGMLQVMIAENLLDHEYIAAHTTGFEALKDSVLSYTPDLVAEICAIPPNVVVETARLFAQSSATLSLYCQGLNQSTHGTHNSMALIQLHLASGQIGKAGAGPFSLTGQANAMGGREVGGLSTLLSAHRDLNNPQHRAEMADFWQVPCISPRPGYTAVELFQALKDSRLKAVWIVCTNPAHSLPHQAQVHAALAAAEFVVVQDAYADTETAEFADLLLPATTWSEKEGTLTNSERRISFVPALVAPPGEARPDWAIATEFALKLGQRLGIDSTKRLFPYTTAESVFNEHRQSTHGRDMDIGGISYDLLKETGAQYWPYPLGATPRTRLYEDGQFNTPDKKAHFHQVAHVVSAEATDYYHPFVLISGRMSDQWHGMNRTGTVPKLFNREYEPLLRIAPEDLQRKNLQDGDIVEVGNQRGKFRVRVQSDEGIPARTIYLPMHWGSRFMNSRAVNAVTTEAFDPYSKQPGLKRATVYLTKCDLPWTAAIIRQCDTQDEAVDLMEKSRVLLPLFSYATVGLLGRKYPLVIFRLAHEQAVDQSVIQRMDEIFEMDGETGAFHFEDARLQIFKKGVIQNGRLRGIRLAGETLALNWLKSAMSDENPITPGLMRYVFAPSATPPTTVTLPQIICQCADVSEAAVDAAIKQGANLEALQSQLKCGTFCGSCIPKLRGKINGLSK